MPEQAPDVRNKNFLEVAVGYTEEMAVNEAMRCLKCRKKPCMSGCPVMVKIPDFIAKVAEGEFEEAYQIISQTSSLPAICGRVCPQETQCEGKCVHGKKGEPKLPEGEKVIVEKGFNGYRGSSYIKRGNGEAVLLNSDYYKPKKQVVKVGTKKAPTEEKEKEKEKEND